MHHFPVQISMSLMDENIIVGTRIGLDNKRGTVKFVGNLNEVDGGKEIWLGIDWDSADQGKHNGSLKGTQYFQTRYPTSGSFVKSKQVQIGQGFMETIRKHFSDLHDNVGNDNNITFVIKSRSFDRMFIMSSINLPNHFISFLEPDASEKFTKCTSLYLPNNLLNDWNELFKLLELFPNLITLDLSSNIIQSTKLENFVPQQQIKELLMNNCQLDHNTIESLSNYFPNLETLRIMANELDSLPNLSNFSNLKHLFIGNNPIGNFEKLWHLAALENLETLSLHGCGIKKFRLPEQTGFKKLQALNLNENSLNDWESINEISRLTCLKNLRTSGLYAGERGCQSYEILVAKLPQVEVLDSCAISARERKECEIYFLNRFYRDPLPEVHQADLVRLANFHNETLQTNENNQVDPNSCTFKLIFSDRTIERTLLLNLTIRKLVTLASRIFDFEPSDVKVSIQVFEDKYELLKWDSSIVLRAFEPQLGCTVKFIEY